MTWEEVTGFHFLFLNRSVWENASPPSDSSDIISEGSLLHKKDIHGSQDTLYHSCWSLSDFPGNEKNDEANEDAKSLNESLLPSNSCPGLIDLGLKWSSYGNSIHGNPVWANIPSVSINLKFSSLASAKDFNLPIKFGTFMFSSHANWKETAI